MPNEAAEEILIRAREIRDAIVDHPATPAPEAIALLQQAMAAAAPEAVAVILSAQAHAYRERLDHARAAVLANEAIAAAEQAGAPAELARCLITRALIELELGDAAAARADLDRARALGPLVPDLALATATVAGHGGHIALARQLFTALVDDPQVCGPVRLKSLNNLAHLLLESHPQEALSLLRQARELVASPQSMAGPVIQFNIGLALAHAGRIPEAMAAFELALQAQDVLGGALAAEFHLGMATVFGQLRLLAEARTAADRALAALAGEGGAMIRADALVSAARLAVADGAPAAARRLLAEAHTLYRAQERPAGTAISALELPALDADPRPERIAAHAARLSELGLVREAGRGWLQAADAAAAAGAGELAEHLWHIAAESSATDTLARHVALARAAAARGERETLTSASWAALEMIDTRAALASAPDLRHRIAAERAGFEQLLRRAGSTDSPSAQLDALLRARPPAALRSVGDSGDAGPAAPSRDRQPGGDVDPEELRLQWRELARRVESAEEDPATLICLGAQLADTERRLRAGAWAEGGSGVGRAASGLDDLVDAVGMPLLVLARIGPDVVGFHHDFGGVTTAVLGRWASLTTDLAHLERALARVASGGEPAAYEKSRVLAGELDDLLGPLVAPSNDSLLVLLDRGLDAGALTALPRLWPRAVCFASLAMTAPTTNRPKAGPPGVLVAVGPRLLHAESESASVATTWNAAAPVATCAAVRAGVPGAGIIHLAAHASLRWDNPLQSVIHFDDGPLALTELCELSHGPETTRLLYLSACSLGAGSSDAALVGAVPMLAERVAREVVAASIPLPDEHAPAIAAAVHRSVAAGGDAACGLAAVRRRVDPDDPQLAGLWAALGCLSAVMIAP